ncbi:RNA polymerase sigma-70 factor (ECF subfamily) [Arthrobacter sp. CAN_A212]|uniref:ECF RNA polymerase sigma factor SigK n=1 Tax=Arthrobacter sp. CAN_A212 TaxID=2787719 RepID=UPI0018CB1667
MNRHGSEDSAALEHARSFPAPPNVPGKQPTSNVSRPAALHTKFTAAHTRLAGFLHRISEGDRDAFSAFYYQTARQVYGLARRIIVDSEIAQETTQEVYLFVWQQARRYDPALGSPMAWLMTITHRRAVDKVRAEQSSTNRAARWASANHSPDYDSVAETAITRVEAQTVATCLERLSTLQGEAINLAYYQCMTYRQVSEHLSIPLSTIKTRIRDGLKNLRLCLERRRT